MLTWELTGGLVVVGFLLGLLDVFVGIRRFWEMFFWMSGFFIVGLVGQLDSGWDFISFLVGGVLAGIIHAGIKVSLLDLYIETNHANIPDVPGRHMMMFIPFMVWGLILGLGSALLFGLINWAIWATVT